MNGKCPGFPDQEITLIPDSLKADGKFSGSQMKGWSD